MRADRLGWRTVAVGLAVFLLTAAAMTRWYVAPQVARLPLDPEVTVTLVGSGQAWDASRGRATAGALRERVAVRGDPGSGSTGTAVWQVERRLTRADGTLVRLAAERVALDRRTAASVACCGERPRHTGLAYAFPAGLDRSTRELFDPTTATAAAVRYVGDDRVGGLPAYRLEQVTGPVELGERPLPGAPQPGAPVTAGVRTVASARRTLWVEPASGLVLRVTERRTERAGPAGPAQLTLLDATLTSDDASTARLVGLARERAGRLRLVREQVPLGLLLAGLVLGTGALIVDRAGTRRRSG